MNARQKYRVVAPGSGRQAVLEPEPGAVYVDRESGEEYAIVSRLLPLAPSASGLPRTPENLRTCPHCDELVGRDLSECPVCNRRLPAAGG